MLSDTLSFKINLELFYVLKKLETIFNKPAEIVRLNGVQKIYHKKSSKYIESMAKIQLGAYAYISVIEYKKRAKSENTCFIEFHGFAQYHKDGTPIVLDIEKGLDDIIKQLKPILWRIEMPYDILMPFDEVASSFDNYDKPYKTTYELVKGSTKFQLYDKRAKDNLEVAITRLEMKKSYSRKRTAIVLTTLEDLKEIEMHLKSEVELEMKSKCLNIYTPPKRPSALSLQLTKQNQYTLNEVEAINILHEEIEALSYTADEVIIHTCKGAISYRDNTLTFSPPLLPIARKLLENAPTVKEILENST